MSVQAMSWVLKESKSQLGARLVLLSIANHAREDGTGAWPSIWTLAKEARLSERQVQRCIRRLQKSGELQVQIGCGPYGTNMYSLPEMGGVKLSPLPLGDISGSKGVTFKAKTIPKMSPKPSLTIHKDKEGRPYTISVDGIRVYL